MALARILLLQPRLVILDEPTSGLDMSVQATVLNVSLELRERFGLTYLFISRDLSVVRRFCDRVAIMYLGRIVEVARADQLFKAPRRPYARTVLDAVPRVDPSAARPVALHGEPASAACRPPGGAFSSRCRHAEPVRQLPAAIVSSSSISAARLSQSRPIVSTANFRPLFR